jgi:hypothetical protein
VDFQDAGAAPPTSDRLIDYLSIPTVKHDGTSLLARYRELSALGDEIAVVPMEPTIIEKLIWPLRQAQSNYVLGNYLGCVALCGVIGEMVALLLWEISKDSLNGTQLDEQDRRLLDDDEFEKLGQTERVAVLHRLKLIDDSTKAAFNEVRGIRRKYLHFLTQSQTQLPSDARQAYRCAAQTVRVVLGVTYDAGAIVFRADLLAFLIKNGVVRAENG